MYTIPHSFLMLQACGLWRPSSWHDNSIKTRLYKSYTIFLSFLIISVTLFELVYLINTIDAIEAFANNSFILLSMIGMCGKAANVLRGRDRIIELTSMLKNEICRSANAEERIIQRKFDDIVRFNTLWYAALAESTVVLMYVGSVLQDIPKKAFPFETWLPWDSQSIAGYWIGYIHQIIAHGAGATINIACDSLIAGLMVQTCAQLNILKNRFTNMPKSIENSISSNWDGTKNRTDIEYLESKTLARCVEHHLTIIQFANKVNSLFEEILFLQFSISTAVICVSVYQLSTLKLFSTEFTSIVMYLVCMSIEVFLLCYYGSEATYESMSICSAIYEMNWDPLGINTKKSLLTIMARTGKPIKFTSARMITVNLDSFNSLIKLSYSAYNLLQQSSQ